MNTIAEFTIIGRVGEIRQVGTTLRVNIASSYSRKDNRGEWVERTRWNEVTVFGESTRGYVKRNIVKGDLVFTSGSMGQTKWEKDGETFYGVTLAGERIERLSKGPNHGDDKGDEPQERRSGPADDSRHPILTCHPEPGRPRPPRLSHRAIGEDANPWPIKFTASENGNASAASTAIPPSAHTFSRVSTRPKPMLARSPLASPTRTTRTVATEALRSSRSAKARSTTSDRRSSPGGPPIRTSSISTTVHSEETRHDTENRG